MRYASGGNDDERLSDSINALTDRADKAEASLGRMREAFKREHDWRIEAEADLKALRERHEKVERLHTGFHQCRGDYYTDGEPYEGTIALRGPCPTRALLSDTGEGT